MYFYYGIKHSSLEEANASENLEENTTAGNIELTVTEPQKSQQPAHHTSPYSTTSHSIYEGQQLDAFGQPVFGSTNFGGTPSQRPAPSAGPSLFISQESFPTWDDWALGGTHTNIYIWKYKINYYVSLTGIERSSAKDDFFGARGGQLSGQRTVRPYVLLRYYLISVRWLNSVLLSYFVFSIFLKSACVFYR